MSPARAFREDIAGVRKPASDSECGDDARCFHRVTRSLLYSCCCHDSTRCHEGRSRARLTSESIEKKNLGLGSKYRRRERRLGRIEAIAHVVGRGEPRLNGFHTEERLAELH